MLELRSPGPVLSGGVVGLQRRVEPAPSGRGQPAARGAVEEILHVTIAIVVHVIHVGAAQIGGEACDAELEILEVVRIAFDEDVHVSGIPAAWRDAAAICVLPDHQLMKCERACDDRSRGQALHKVHFRKGLPCDAKNLPRA
eukprot:7265701-Prymnesium_polylepis.1